MFYKLNVNKEIPLDWTLPNVGPASDLLFLSIPLDWTNLEKLKCSLHFFVYFNEIMTVKTQNQT